MFKRKRFLDEHLSKEHGIEKPKPVRKSSTKHLTEEQRAKKYSIANNVKRKKLAEENAQTFVIDATSKKKHKSTIEL